MTGPRTIFLAVLVAAGCSSPASRTSVTAARRQMEKGQLLPACRALEDHVQRADGDRDGRLDAIRTWIDCLDRTGALSGSAAVLGKLEPCPRHYGQALVAVARSPAGLPRALDLLKRASRLWPEQVELPYRIGVLLLADEQPARALRHLERAAALRDTAAVAVARAHALLDLGRMQDALTQVRRVPDLQPDATEIRRGRALIQRVARRTQVIPPSARKAYREALDLLQRRDLAGQCIRKLEEILLDHPRLAPVHTVLGLAHLRLGNAAEAVTALRRAHRLNPLDATNPLYLAVIYQKRGQASKSITHYREALALDPFLLRAARELGQLLLREGRGEEAADVLERVLVLDGGTREAHRLAGRAHMAAGALRQAERHFADLARGNPDDFEINLRLGQLLLRRYHNEGRPKLLERARHHIQRAAKARPDDAEVQELRQEIQRERRQN